MVGTAAVAPVVKADAYGHGVDAVGPALAPFVEALCVATLDEAIALRPRVAGRILLLYPVPAAAAAEAVAAGVELAVMSAADLEAIRAVAPLDDRPVKVHIGVETGMGRGGLPPDAVAAVAAIAVSDTRIELAGLWSHLHSPEDPPSSDAQVLRFERAVAALREAGIPVPPRHIAASGGIFTHDEPSLDLVRPGHRRLRRPRCRPAHRRRCRRGRSAIAPGDVAQGSPGGLQRRARRRHRRLRRHVAGRAAVAHRGPAGRLRRRLPARLTAWCQRPRARPTRARSWAASRWMR